MNLFKRILPDIVVIILFAVISFVYFFPAVTEGRILSQHDSVAGIGAGEEAKEYLERTGERTRWTNSIFGGMPTYQMAPSYDSTDTLKGVEKLYHLYLPNYVWYVFVMLLGFYILLRAFDFSVWLASLGAVLWAFSSYFFIIISYFLAKSFNSELTPPVVICCPFFCPGNNHRPCTPAKYSLLSSISLSGINIRRL